jgi:cardiolipin synthase A/B
MEGTNMDINPVNPAMYDPNLVTQALDKTKKNQKSTSEAETQPSFSVKEPEDSVEFFQPQNKLIEDNGDQIASTSSKTKLPGDPHDTFNTTVTPKVNGDEIFPTAHEMITNAKSSVNVEMYELQNSKIEGKPRAAGITDDKASQSQEALIQDMVDASKRGVKVQVLLDHSKEKDGTRNNEKVADYLKANGVEVLYYPESKAKIDHVKLLVVDNDKALIGGMNWGTHSPVNRDADVLIEGKEAAELKQDIFNKDWDFAGGKAKDLTLDPNREDKVQVLTTAPVEEGGGSSSIKKAILDNIDGSQKSVHAELFSLTDRDVVDSLIHAKDRGVDVKVLLDPNLYIINRKAFNELKDAGVDVRWYKVDVEKQEKLHAKWGVFDDEKTIMGSANWSASGLEGGGPGKRTNHEADVLVSDNATANRFEQEFMSDWDTKSSVTTPKHMPFN